MVTKSEGKPMPERGGRRKMYYTITPQGRKVLQKALAVHQTLWNGVTVYALQKENVD
jgi:DNA-binding PadR family transcriptional regulator